VIGVTPQPMLRLSGCTGSADCGGGVGAGPAGGWAGRQAVRRSTARHTGQHCRMGMSHPHG
jgi:hypothetical protein